MQLSESYYVELILDLALNLILLLTFSRLQLIKTWQYVQRYLLVRFSFGTFLLLVILAQNKLSHVLFERIYAATFYAGYIALITISYMLYVDLFRRAMLPFPGFAKHARKIIYCGVGGTAILLFSSIGSSNAGTDALARAGIAFVRATSTIDFCIAAFLLFVVYSLGLPLRNRVFGIVFGIFVNGVGDVAQTILAQLHTPLVSPSFSIVEMTSILSAVVWIAYAYIPEPAPRPVTLPADSTVYRWSQIAAALGKTGAQVALPEPQHSFFLTDVEKVVDRVFARNMVGKESER